MAQDFVLIVEDSEYLAEAIAEVVSSMGYATVIVSSGEDALAALEGDQPALVLLDWILPGIVGIEVLRNIRENIGTELPVVMLTAKGDLDARVMGLETGADDYITKPVHMKELKARIANVLRRNPSDNGQDCGSKCGA